MIQSELTITKVEETKKSKSEYQTLQAKMSKESEE